MEKIKSRWAKLALLSQVHFIHIWYELFFDSVWSLQRRRCRNCTGSYIFAWKDHRFWRQKCVWYRLLFGLIFRFLFWHGKNGKGFLVKTLIGSVAISIFASIIPIPSTPIVDSVVASVLIAGIITGFGVGLLLVAGGSGGGVDVIGMWAARKFKNASVGKISLYVNVVVYASLLLMFDIEIVIYSLIYMVFFTLMMDRVHYQNITVRLMIFTKQEME